MSITLQHGGISIEILDGLYLSNGQPTPEAISYYTSLVVSIDALKLYATQKLLSLYNDVWLDEEIGKLSEQSFMQKLTHPSIHLYDEIGMALVYFEDGGIFAGHSIEVTVKSGAPFHAQIVG